jgi:hypothetical protein
MYESRSFAHFDDAEDRGFDCVLIPTPHQVVRRGYCQYAMCAGCLRQADDYFLSDCTALAIEIARADSAVAQDSLSESAAR